MKFDNYIGLILNRASRKVSHFKMTFLKDYDITTEQSAIIRRLGEKDGISQKDLAKQMEKDQTNVTRILDQLEKKKLILIGANSEDRRSFLIYLTDKGKVLNEEMLPIEHKVMDIVFKGISEEKRLLFMEVIDEIAKNINDYKVVDTNNKKRL